MANKGQRYWLNSLETQYTIRSYKIVEFDSGTRHHLFLSNGLIGFLSARVDFQNFVSYYISSVCSNAEAVSGSRHFFIFKENINTMNNNEELVPLSSLSLGQKALIVAFSFATKDGEKVQEMGLTPGEQLEIVKKSPLGDSFEIKIRGYFLSLPKQQADYIKVRPLR